MKILLIHNRYRIPTGEETYLAALEKILKNHGHRVITYTKDNNNLEESFTKKLRIFLHYFYAPDVNEEIKKIITKENPDIAHVHNIYPLITPFVYKVLGKHNIPVVQTIHNFRLICPGGFLFSEGKECIHARKGISHLRKLFHRCYRNSYRESLLFSLVILFHKLYGSYKNINFFIFPSKSTKRIHQNLAQISPKYARILSCLFESEIKKTVTKNAKADYFLYVGRLSKEKGILQLLDIFSRLPHTKLVVIGNGPLQTEVLQYQRYANIDVITHISREKIFTYYRNAHMTIIPSRWLETGPLVLQESYSQGTPVLVPRIGSFIDFTKHKKTGLFFTFNNFTDLKQKINYASSNKAEIKQMQKHVIKYYREHFSPDTHYQKLIEIYQEALHKKV